MTEEKPKEKEEIIKIVPNNISFGENLFCMKERERIAVENFYLMMRKTFAKTPEHYICYQDIIDEYKAQKKSYTGTSLRHALWILIVWKDCEFRIKRNYRRMRFKGFKKKTMIIISKKSGTPLRENKRRKKRVQKKCENKFKNKVEARGRT